MWGRGEKKIIPGAKCQDFIATHRKTLNFKALLHRAFWFNGAFILLNKSWCNLTSNESVTEKFGCSFLLLKYSASSVQVSISCRGQWLLDSFLGMCFFLSLPSWLSETWIQISAPTSDYMKPLSTNWFLLQKKTLSQSEESKYIFYSKYKTIKEIGISAL